MLSAVDCEKKIDEWSEKNGINNKGASRTTVADFSLVAIGYRDVSIMFSSCLRSSGMRFVKVSQTIFKSIFSYS